MNQIKIGNSTDLQCRTENSFNALSQRDTNIQENRAPLESVMLEVSPKASETMADYCRDKEKLPVRIFLTQGGCGVRSFGVALEAAEASDELFEVDGISYVISRRLLKQYGPIKINSDGFSFRISGKGIHPPTGCGTCAYGCGSRGGNRCSGVCSRCETPCSTGRRIRARRTSTH